MQVTVKTIAGKQNRTSTTTGKPYVLTTFVDNDGKLYEDVYGDLNVGQVVEGDWVDHKFKAGAKQFEIKRQPRAFGGGGTKEFKADPEKQKSIEWQNALNNAREATRDFYTLCLQKNPAHVDLPTRENYNKEIVKAAIAFHKVIATRPEPASETLNMGVPESASYGAEDYQ